MGLALGAILLPIAASFTMPLLYPLLLRRLGWAALAVAAATLSLVVLTPPDVVQTLAWVPQLGIDLTVQADGWSRLMAVLIAGIGSLVILYSIPYLGPKEDLGKFYTYILLFMGAMLGVSYSGNLVTLYIFWELTSVSSFLLIGFWYTRTSGIYGALKSMILTVGGGLTMLAGIVLLGNIGGTYELADLIARRGEVLAHPMTGIALLLILVGAFSKSAQAPFHIWLPDAMAAPTPISAYLHSATMVKAGIFLVARLWPLFAAHPWWPWSVSTIGLITLALGGYLALTKTDLKAILALSTVSQLGLVMTLFGFGTQDAAAAGVFHLLNHATFKGLLFMIVGIIDHETGTRDINNLSGLRRAMPVSAALAVIGAASMAGVPPLNGFLSKEMFLEATLHSPFGVTAAVIATLASILTTTYCLVVAHKVFFGKTALDTPKHPHEASWLMLTPPAILAVLVVAIGLVPGLVEGWLVIPAIAAVTGVAPDLHIALWHGLTPALSMSAIALGGGLLAYRFRENLVSAIRRRAPETLHTNRLYDWLWWREEVVERSARWLTDIQMTGLLRDYLVFILGAAVAGFLATIWLRGVSFSPLTFSPIQPFELVLLGVVVAGAFATIFSRVRLAAMASISMVGLPVSLYFAWMRAPDLALTQLVVEVVTAALFLVVFAYLPQLKVYPRTTGYQDMNIVISIGVGLIAALVTLLSMNEQLFTPEIAPWYLENSHSAAGGNNVVNVTLVDFRGFDTMGEISVLAIATLSIYALIRLRLGSRGGKQQ